MKSIACCFALVCSALFANSQTQLLRVGVAGMAHDHIHGILQQYQRGEVIIVGIAEADAGLRAKYKDRYHLQDSLFFNDLNELLNHTKPEAVLAYNAISDHLSVVQMCAPRGVPVMVEKPLATTVKQADEIAALSARYHIPVLVNYETTWYRSNHTLFDLVHKDEAIGLVRKMVVHDGHQGPKEIGCSPDFLAWLTDPVKNGGGALVDFGCYGANLMTWMMDGKAPLSVMAITRHYKPDVYPKVDDEATIILEYPGATGIIEASWNWPFGIKDFEVFGERGYLHALNGNDLQMRKKDVYEPVETTALKFPDNLKYLTAVLRGGTIPANDLSSLENNLIVVRILEAARQSAKEGKKITL